jgi:hypothetical protein
VKYGGCIRASWGGGGQSTAAPTANTQPQPRALWPTDNTERSVQSGVMCLQLEDGFQKQIQVQVTGIWQAYQGPVCLRGTAAQKLPSAPP